MRVARDGSIPDNLLQRRPIRSCASHPAAVLRSAIILRQWIIWSTILGCFSAGAAFYIGSVHFLYFYPVLLFNLWLLALCGSLWFPPGLLLLLGFTAFSGVAGIAQGTNSLALFVKSEFGIVFSAIYACAFLRFTSFDAVDILRRYAKIAYVVALIGLPIYVVVVAVSNPLYRLQSIEGEPGELCIVTLPALYYFADRWQRHREGAWKFFVLLVAVLLSRSSIGLMGIFVGLYLFTARFRFGALFGPVFIAVLGFLAYSVSPDFQLRLDDSVAGVALLDASSLNNSSFSLLSGAYVAGRSVLDYPLTGVGLGGTAAASDRYIAGLPGISLVNEEVWAIARGDSGSMLSRLATETGLPGVLLALGFLWYCYPRGASEDRKQTANALLVYVFVKMLRSGVYFNPEVLLLMTVYAVNGAPVLHRAMEQARGSHAPTLAMVGQQA